MDHAFLFCPPIGRPTLARKLRFQIEPSKFPRATNMLIRSGAEWLALCKEKNKLQVSLRRHIHQVDNYIVKIDLAANEPDYYGDFNDPLITRLLDENAKAMTGLVANATTIPVPQFVEDGYLSGYNGASCYFSVWKYINGYSLEERWDQLMMKQKIKVM